MIINYKFANGETSQIEVTDEVAEIVAAFDRAESSADRRHRAHCYSLDAAIYEGIEYADKTADIEQQLVYQELELEIEAALQTLTDKQRMYVELSRQGLGVSEIGVRIGRSPSTVCEGLAAARKRIKCVKIRY